MLPQWLHIFEERNDKFKQYRANTTEFRTITASLRYRGWNTQHGQIPSIRSDGKGFLSRKDTIEIKQKSNVRHYWHQGKLISIWAQYGRIQMQMLGEHLTASECQKKNELLNSTLLFENNTGGLT